MKASSLADRVLGVVMDSSFDDTSVVEMLSDCLRRCIAPVYHPVFGCCIHRYRFVNRQQHSIAANFQRNLYFCDDGTSFGDIRVCNSKDQLSRYYDQD